MKKNLPTLIILVLLLVILLAGAGLFIYVQYSVDKAEQEKIEAEAAANGEQEAPKKEAKEKTKGSYEYFLELGESFVTNVTDSDNFVKCSMTLSIDEKKHEEFLASQIVVIRSVIIGILRSKTYDQMRQPDIQQTLAEEICAALNDKFGVSYFNDVYFSDLVIQ